MRVFLMVLDSVGLGAAPDAHVYGDDGADTLGHILKAYPDLPLRNLSRLGLFHIEGTSFRNPQGVPEGCYARATELSAGKDTTTGHWEMAGIRLDKPFPLYPDGFPDDIIKVFSARTGRGVLGNCKASGTEIIDRLGGEQLRSGEWIVYTSADSVFQVAAHERVIPLEELYEGCRIARELLTGDNAVGRVIARPYDGEPGQFHRTDRRRDFSLQPPSETLLDRLKGHQLDVIAIGKIEDIFAGRGVTQAIHTYHNADGINRTLAVMDQPFHGLAFTNLVDFDMLYGHRNDVKGYAEALVQADEGLGEIMARMGEDDVLMVTADHGCDPTSPSTDHTRERVPLLIFGPGVRRGVDLGTRQGFWDCSATVLSLFGLPPIQGKSMTADILGS